MTKNLELKLTPEDESDLRAYFAPREVSAFDATIARMAGATPPPVAPDAEGALDAERVGKVLAEFEPHHLRAFEAVYGRSVAVDVGLLKRCAPDVWQAWRAASTAYVLARL